MPASMHVTINEHATIHFDYNRNTSRWEAPEGFTLHTTDSEEWMAQHPALDCEASGFHPDEALAALVTDALEEAQKKAAAANQTLANVKALLHPTDHTQRWKQNTIHGPEHLQPNGQG